MGKRGYHGCALLLVWWCRTVGFSPNDLVFEHSVHGPLTILKAECQPVEPLQNILGYVKGFRHRLYRTWQMAKENLQQAQKKMKTQFDQHVVHRQFIPGSQVLILLSVVESPFQARFSGPFTVVKQVSECDY